jgi:UDP-N-acetylglucosamine/UDP-N-acetylgalactosamine diphosphorylase
VFAHWDVCTADERRALCAQLSEIDLPRVTAIHARSLATHRAGAAAAAVEPFKAHDSVLGAEPGAVERWRQRGLQIAGAGQLAVVLLAGGQGTRLGSQDPKVGRCTFTPSQPVLKAPVVSELEARI